MKKSVDKISKAQIKKGDTVKVLSGKDRGKQGRALLVDYKKNRVTVEGVNMAKKAVRPTQENQKGGIMDVAMAIHLSNAKLICPKCNKATSVGRKLIDNKRVRVCKNSKCNEIIDKV